MTGRAKRARRSLNSQIVIALDEFMKDRNENGKMLRRKDNG